MRLMRGAPARPTSSPSLSQSTAPNLPATGHRAARCRRPRMFVLPLMKIGTSGVYAGVATLTHGAAFTWHYEAGGARLGGGQLEVYETHRTRACGARRAEGHAQANALVDKAKSLQARRATGGLCARAIQCRESSSRDVFQDGATAHQSAVPVFRQPDCEGDIRSPSAFSLNPAASRTRATSQFRVRHVVRSVRAFPAGRNPPRSREDRHRCDAMPPGARSPAKAAAQSRRSRWRGNGQRVQQVLSGLEFTEHSVRQDAA